MTNRRGFLATSALVGAGVIAGCANLKNVTPAVVGQAVVNNLSLIKAGVAALLAVLGTVNVIPPATLVTVTAKLQTISTFINTVAVGMSQAAAQPIIQQIVATFGAVVTALQGLTLPTTVQNILKAIQILMPVIETAVGILIAGAQPKAADVDWAKEVLANS